MPHQPNKGVGNLTVEVYEEDSVVGVQNASVKITSHSKPPGHFRRPVSLSASTGLFGYAKFTGIPVGMYKVEISRKWYEPTIIRDVFAKIPGNDPVGSFVKPKNLAKIKFPRTAPWMKTAINEIGQKEIPGPKKANPRILEYHKAARFEAKDDSGGENAWCGAFVSWIMKQHGYTLPKYAMRALAWKDFGKSIKKPILGAIGIKKRKKGGHVAFVVGQSRNGEFLYMLYGNQDDQVNIRRYKRDIWEKFVIPTDYFTRCEMLPIYNRKAVVGGKES